MPPIKTIVEDPEIGAIYKGRVTRLMNFGAFVEIAPGKEGLVHIPSWTITVWSVWRMWLPWAIPSSSWSTDIDQQGRINLSRKDALAAIAKKRAAQAAVSKIQKETGFPREPVSFFVCVTGEKMNYSSARTSLVVAGNHQFLVGFHHKRADAGAPGGDLHHILVLAAHTAVFVVRCGMPSQSM